MFVGFDIGARGLVEIVVLIFVEIVFECILYLLVVEIVVDFVCGMEVVVSDATLHIGDVYFCCEGCWDVYVACM